MIPPSKNKPNSLGDDIISIDNIWCVTSLLLLKKSPQNNLLKNNTDLLTYSSGGQEFDMGLTGLKIKILAGLCSLLRPQEENASFPFPAPRGQTHPLAYELLFISGPIMLTTLWPLFNSHISLLPPPLNSYRKGS